MVAAMAMAVTAPMAQMAGRGDYMDWDDGSYWGMVIMMIVVAVVFVAVVVWAVVYASRNGPRDSGGAGGTGTPSGPSARDVLDQRYARGEIETADYEERRSKLV